MLHEWDRKLVIGITSTALFDLRESQRVFVENRENPEAYYKYTLEHENDIPNPGTGFHLVKALLALNQRRQERLVEVVLISRNDADTGFRISKAIRHHKLDIFCGAFTGGGDQYPFLNSFACDLFLSTDLNEVRSANKMTKPVPAALAYGQPGVELGAEQVRIAFDADCVLFSEETQRAYEKAKKVSDAVKFEKRRKSTPLPPGPFKPFLEAVNRIQKTFSRQKLDPNEWPIQTYLVTARNLELCERPILTLRKWGIRLNKSFYLGGLKKWHVLSILKPHIFFDDQQDNLADILGGLVPRDQSKKASSQPGEAVHLAPNRTAPEPPSRRRSR
jgi:5'-nucleotidase